MSTDIRRFLVKERIFALFTSWPFFLAKPRWRLLSICVEVLHGFMKKRWLWATDVSGSGDGIMIGELWKDAENFL